MRTSLSFPRLQRAALAMVAMVTLLVAATPLAVGAATVTAATVAADPVGTQDYLARINAERAAAGAGPLALDAELSALAEQHSATMAAQNRLHHAGDLSVGVTQGWSVLGENVGMGSDVATIWAAFLASPTHRDNVVRADFDRIGIGIVWVGSTQWVTHRFLAEPGTAPPPPPPPAPAPGPAPVPAVATPPTTAAPAPPARPAPPVPAPATTVPAPTTTVPPTTVPAPTTTAPPPRAVPVPPAAEGVTSHTPAALRAGRGLIARYQLR